MAVKAANAPYPLLCEGQCFAGRAFGFAATNADDLDDLLPRLVFPVVARETSKSMLPLVLFMRSSEEPLRRLTVCQGTTRLLNKTFVTRHLSQTLLRVDPAAASRMQAMLSKRSPAAKS